LLNLRLGKRDVAVEVDVAAAEAFLDFDELELHPWAELVKLDGDRRVLFLILIVFRKDDS